MRAGGGAAAAAVGGGACFGCGAGGDYFEACWKKMGGGRVGRSDGHGSFVTVFGRLLLFFVFVVPGWFLGVISAVLGVRLRRAGDVDLDIHFQLVVITVWQWFGLEL